MMVNSTAQSQISKFPLDLVLSEPFFFVADLLRFVLKNREDATLTAPEIATI